MNSKNELKLIRTADGSFSLYTARFKDSYHSSHGALREAKHVYIEAGLEQAHARHPRALRLLELGFGTGLNALLSLQYARKHELKLHYVALEAYPLSEDWVEKLNYPEILQLTEEEQQLFRHMHLAPWNEPVQLSPNFVLEKRLQKFEHLEELECFDLLYYDAFGPQAQATLWGDEMVARVYNALRKGAVLTTFCAQGAFRRSLEAVGFRVERLPGPPGKREMLRAWKEEG